MHFTFSEGSTKEKIIALLSENWPLKARKIYRSLIKQNKISVTYQATHKALKELTDNLILEKTKEGYIISKNWIRELGDFSEKVKSDLSEAGRKKELRTMKKIVFSSHADFIKFHLGFIEEVLRSEKRLNMIFYFRHVPSPNVLSTEDILRLKPFMPKIKWVITSKNSNPLGRWNAKYWNRIGVKVFSGREIPTDSRMIVMNDYIINIYSSKEANDLWDKIYSAKNVDSSDVHEITKGIVNKKYKTILTVFKDKEIANLIRASY